MSYNPIITVNTHIKDTNLSFKVPFGFGGGVAEAGMSFWNPCTGKLDKLHGGWEFIRNTALGAFSSSPSCSDKPICE